jgi:hypothetical protein
MTEEPEIQSDVWPPAPAGLDDPPFHARLGVTTLVWDGRFLKLRRLQPLAWISLVMFVHFAYAFAAFRVAAARAAAATGFSPAVTAQMLLARHQTAFELLLYIIPIYGWFFLTGWKQPAATTTFDAEDRLIWHGYPKRQRAFAELYRVAIQRHMFAWKVVLEGSPMTVIALAWRERDAIAIAKILSDRTGIKLS